MRQTPEDRRDCFLCGEIMKRDLYIDELKKRQSRAGHECLLLEEHVGIREDIIHAFLEITDGCSLCEKKGQKLEECKRVTNKECMENLIKLWSVEEE